MKVVITGSSSGIGLALVKKYLDEGFSVLGVDINQSKEKQFHSHFSFFQADLSKEEEIDRLFIYLEEHYSEINMFIANAGFAYYERLKTPSWEHIKKIYDLNVLSPIYSFLKMKELVKDQAFKFVITSSAMGYWPLPGYSLYSSTKAAIGHFAKAIQFELEKNQSVHSVFPVATKTNFFKESGQSHSSWFEQSPEHVANVIYHGVRKRKKKIYPSKLFRLVHAICPFCLRLYIHREQKKMRDELK
jgi:short-subunit dehydrogenase